jgi:hypothetical protein
VDTVARAELKKYREAAQRGDPRPFTEAYLWIMTEDGDATPLKYDGNQDYYWRETFGGLKAYTDPLEVVLVKDRAARFSTWIQSVNFTMACCVPGFRSATIIDSEKNLKQAILPMLDQFYDNLPDWMKPVKEKWGEELRSFIFKDRETGRTARSIMAFSSSRTKNFLRGAKPKLFVWDERAASDPIFEEDLETSSSKSLPLSAWRFDGSTPSGQATGFYSRFREIYAGRGSQVAKVLLRRHFDRPENAMGADHPKSNIVDAHTPLELSEQEHNLTQLFNPADGILPEKRIRWRRAMIQDAIASARGDKDRALGRFNQEHPENLVDCWYVPEGQGFPRDTVRGMVERCKAPLETTRLLPGIDCQVWERFSPGRRFVAFIDPASGLTQGDNLCMQIGDAVRRTHVAQIFGKYNMTRFVQACCRFLDDSYPGTLLAIERTGTQGGPVDAAIQWGYRNLYRPRAKNTRDPRAQLPPYGFDTNKATRPMMHEATWQGLYDGTLISYSEELLLDMLQYDDKKDHLPDRLAAFMGMVLVMEERGMELRPAGISRNVGDAVQVISTHPY